MADVWFYPFWPLAVADSELLQSAKALHEVLALGNLAVRSHSFS